MSKAINFVAANNATFTANVNDDATYLDAFNAAIEAGFINSATEFEDAVYTINGDDVTSFIEAFADVACEDGDTIGLDERVTVRSASNSNNTCNTVEQTVATITVTVTAAGGISPRILTMPTGSNVLEACRMGQNVLNMTDSAINNAEKYVNDVVANNNTVLRDGDAITVTVRCAGVKGAGYMLRVYADGYTASRYVQGALLKLSKRALIEGLLTDAYDNGYISTDTYDKVVIDGCTLVAESDFAQTWLDAPMTSDLDVTVVLEGAHDSTDTTCELPDDEDEDEEPSMEANTPGFINVILPGGVSNTTFDLRADEPATVRSVVTDIRMLALSGMNESQALAMAYTINDVSVGLDEVLEGGDTLAMFTREAGVKGV